MRVSIPFVTVFFFFFFNFTGRQISNVFCKDVAILFNLLQDCLTTTKDSPPPTCTKSNFKKCYILQIVQVVVNKSKPIPNWSPWHCIIQGVCESGQRSHLRRGQAFQRAKDISCEASFMSWGDIKCLQNPLDETVSEVV